MAKIYLKKHTFPCPNCHSFDVIVWAKTSSKNVRFKCKNCSKTFTRVKNKKLKLDKYFYLFSKWVSTTTIVSELIGLSATKVSHRNLLRYFYAFLDKPPQPTKLTNKKHINLKADATHFGRWGCCIVFKENQNIIFWHFCARETYQNYVYCLARLVELGYLVDSVTSDKHGSIFSAVSTMFETIPHQICLVHIQRRCQTLLTKNPATKVGKELLDIALFVNKIESENDKDVFVKWLLRYEKRYESFVNEKTYAKDVQHPKIDKKTGKHKTW